MTGGCDWNLIITVGSSRQDEFGICGPLELLRSWMDYEGWYDIKDKTFSKMKNI